MNTIFYIRKILTINIKQEIKRMNEFKLNYLLDFISNIFFICSNLLFWECIYSNSYMIPLWSRSEILVFLAFVELFFGIKNGFFSSVSRFSDLIVTGKLDAILIRPQNVLVRVMISYLNIFEVIKGGLMFMVLINISNLAIPLLSIVCGIIVCFIGAIILSLIQLCISFIAFEFGRIEAVIEIIDSLMNFNKYPLNIFPSYIYILFKYFIPFALFSTIPAFLCVKDFNSEINVFIVLVAILWALVWNLITKYLWEVNIKKYESYNS